MIVHADYRNRLAIAARIGGTLVTSGGGLILIAVVMRTVYGAK
ncbi:MAG TPA: hypothetical protein VGS13_00930 [Stellaceae bacterium]|nr:hypothetical protein [Stellaceae bacterium]